jgi:hypothetical protein
VPKQGETQSREERVQSRARPSIEVRSYRAAGVIAPGRTSVRTPYSSFDSRRNPQLDSLVLVSSHHCFRVPSNGMPVRESIR